MGICLALGVFTIGCFGFGADIFYKLVSPCAVEVVNSKVFLTLLLLNQDFVGVNVLGLFFPHTKANCFPFQ